MTDNLCSIETQLNMIAVIDFYIMFNMMHVILKAPLVINAYDSQKAPSVVAFGKSDCCPRPLNKQIIATYPRGGGSEIWEYSSLSELTQLKDAAAL